MSSSTSASQTGLHGGSAQAGIALMALAMFLVPMGDTMSKFLTGELSPFEIAFWRFGFQVVFLGIAMLAFRQRFRARHFGLLALGGVMAAATLASIIGAFTVMPIATAISIFFVEPLVLTVFSAIFLKEKTGWRRYLAVAVGLVGAVIVIRPNWATFGWQAILPLGTAMAFSANMIIVRRLTREMTGLCVQFWISVFAVLVLGISLGLAGGAGLFAWSAFSVPRWVLGFFPAMGLLSAFTYFLFSEAFRRTPASTLAPFQYLEIIGATAMGYIFFGDFPDAVTWFGTAIILGSGIYVFHRERRLERAEVTAAQGGVPPA